MGCFEDYAFKPEMNVDPVIKSSFYDVCYNVKLFLNVSIARPRARVSKKRLT